MYRLMHKSYDELVPIFNEKLCRKMMNSQLFISKIRCSTLLLPNWDRESDFNINDHVDIWRIPVKKIQNQIQTVLKYLTPQETKMMKKLKKESERLQYAISKGFLKFLLSKYLNCPPSDLEISYGMNNKPFLKDNRDLYFNISHSHDWVIFAFCSEELGVDIEFIDSRIDFMPLIRNHFSGPETNFIESSYSPRHEFFKLWTRKESLLKATSLSMTENLNLINCMDGIQYIPYEVGGGFADWKIKSLLMDELYVMSISFPVHFRKIRFFDAI
ncbi:hypothetical protein GCM10028791_06580 [Echinicola sediminis]